MIETNTQLELYRFFILLIQRIFQIKNQGFFCCWGLKRNKSKETGRGLQKENVMDTRGEVERENKRGVFKKIIVWDVGQCRTV